MEKLKSPPYQRLSELIDLLKQQREIAESLSSDFDNFSDNAEVAEMWRVYLSNLQAQDELIFQFAKRLEISFENYMYKKLVEK